MSGESRTGVELAAVEKLAHIGSWVWELATDGVDWSDELYRIFGYSPRSIQPSRLLALDALHPEDRGRVVRKLEESTGSGEGYFDIHRVLGADGRERIVEGRAEVIRDEAGRPVRLVGTVQDITERVRLLDEVHRLAAIVQFSEDAIIGAGLDGTIESWNSGAERLYGYTALEAVGQPLTLIVPASEAQGLPGMLQRIGRGEAIEHHETEKVAKGGTRVAVSLSVSPIRNAAGKVTGVAAIARDISERKRAENELRVVNANLQQTLVQLRITQQQMIQSEKLVALGTVAAGVAHELNNPMMGLLNYVEYARQTAHDPELRELLAKADRELQRMRELLNSMLGLAQPAGEPMTSVDLREVVAHAVDLFRADFRATGIDLRLKLPRDLPFVTGVAAPLQQVLVNLLMNARDATVDCPVRRISVTASTDEARVHLEVHDTGIGIPEEIRSDIFDPFFTTKPPGQGTGLGLSISQRIIGELGGTITVESSPGGETVLRVTLPRAADPAPV